MAGSSAETPRVPAEERVFSLVLALVASPQGVSRAELLSSVYGYAGRASGGAAGASANTAVERQFERDKEQLRRLGLPLETIDPPLETGDNKLTRYRIPKDRLQLPSGLRFSAEELSMLRLASLAWSEGSLGSESRWAGMKLASLGAGVDVRALGISLRLGIPEPAAAPLQRAIDERRVVRFAYQLPDKDAPLERLVAPLRLHRAEGRWHLIGHDLERGAVRVFLLSRIASPVANDANHDQRYDAALLAGVEPSLEELRARQRSQRVRVRVRPGSVAEARLGARGETYADTAGSEDRAAASGLLEFGTLDLHALASELAGYGDEALVLAPPELVAAVTVLLRAVREAHGAVHVSSEDAVRPHVQVDAVQVQARGGAPSRTLTTPDRVMLLMALVPYLLEHGPTHVADLAAAFDVDARTIRRLVQFLGVAGVPGETRTYQHEDLFDIDWDALEQHDVVELTQVVAVDDTPRFSGLEAAALIAGLHVLRSMLPPMLGEQAERLAEKLAEASLGDSVPAALSVEAEPEHRSLEPIAAAMEAGRRLTFEYRDAAGSSTTRTVEPLLLGQSGGAWYLRAFCLDRQAERTFLVDRMRAPRPHGAAAERAPVTIDTPIGVLEPALTTTISARQSALHRIADFAPRVLGEAGTGRVRAEVELLHPQVAARLVQAAPGELVVEAPPAARQSVVNWADRALAQYDDG